jgi:hypothetical protein
MRNLTGRKESTSPMNKDKAPPWALDANAKESDSVEALQLEKTFPIKIINDERNFTKPTRQFPLTNETAVNPTKKLMPPPLTSAPLLRPNKILLLTLQCTIELFDNEKTLRWTSVLPMVLN